MRRIRADIISGALPPGVIIRDVELARRYNVSTSPIREALISLEIEHLVQRASEKVRQVTPITKRKVQEIGDVITLLMDHAILTGIEHLSEVDQALMTIEIEAMRRTQSERNPHKSLNHARRFFDIIIRAGKNEALRQTIVLHAGWIERVFTLAIPIERAGWNEMAEEILEAINRKDSRLIAKVIKRRHKYFKNLLDEIPIF